MTGGPSIGIYGGTFNPIHLGHLRAAQEVAETLDLDRVLFVPSARPPHKRDGAGALAPAADRLAWVRAAVADNPLFEVDPIEVERRGPSYLVDTLLEIGARTAGPPVFILGQDAFSEMGTWREPERIVTLAHFAVTTRPPIVEGKLGEWIPTALRGAFELDPDGASGRHRETGTWIRLLPITPLDISATELRARIRTERSIRYLVPEGVRESIVESGCYRGGSSAGEGRP
jgi:nicotinate-nucleotide adenylyltransferase